MDKSLSYYVGTRDNNFNLIRFVAASLVLYSHSFALLVGTGEAEPLRKTLGITWGIIAVDVFFVTSGFLIASSLFGSKNFLAFIWARILRIYPALIVAVLVSVFILGLFFTNLSLEEYLTSSQTYKYLFKNIVLFFGVEFLLPGVFNELPYKDVVNGSLWTLPYEVKMYVCLLAIAFVFFIVQKISGINIRKYTCLIIAVLALTIHILNHYFNFIPISVNAFRLFTMFFIGTAFYVWRHCITLSPKVFVVALILIMISTYHKEVFFVVYSVLVAYVVFCFAYLPNGRIREFNRLGDYSYGMYIYAFPVQQALILSVEGISIQALVLASFTITIMFAYISWHVIEKKCLQMKKGYVGFERYLVRVMRIKNVD